MAVPVVTTTKKLDTSFKPQHPIVIKLLYIPQLNSDVLFPEQD
jgi:hypothetical protein